MPDFIAIPTLAGKARIAAALVPGGAPLTITHLAVGDGNGTPVTPLETQVALVREVWRGAVTSVTRDPAHLNQVVVVATIPEAAGPFMVREIGLYDTDGTLIAVASHPQIEKTALAQGTAMALDVTAILVVDTAASLTLVLENRPQSDWAEADTTSPAYIRNKPVIPGLPGGLVHEDRAILTRVGLIGGGDFSDDRTHDIDWDANIEAATGLSASDRFVLRQLPLGQTPRRHVGATLAQLVAWLAPRMHDGHATETILAHHVEAAGTPYHIPTGIWTKLPVNDVRANGAATSPVLPNWGTINTATGTITLLAGNYLLEASHHMEDGMGCALRLWSETANVEIERGMSVYNFGNFPVTEQIPLRAAFTLTDTTALAIQAWVSNNGNGGLFELGYPDAGPAGEREIYGVYQITRIN